MQAPSLSVGALLRTQLALLAVAIPFGAVGVEIGNFIISPPVVLGVFVSLTMLFTQRYYPPVIFLYAAMLAWFLITCIGRYSPASYALSLSSLILMSLPVVAAVPSQDTARRMMVGLRVGLTVTLGIVFIDLASQFLGVDVVAGIFDIVFPYGARGQFLGYTRPKAGFLEPAHLSLYLAVSFAALDVGEPESRVNRSLRRVTALAVALTGSLSGVILLVAYLTVRSIARGLKLFTGNIRFQRKTMLYFLLMLIAGMLLFSVLNREITDFFSYQMARVERTALVFSSATFEGSEGSRANALRVLFMYWQTEGLSGLFFGTGYANYEAWLLENFGYLNPILSSFARGQINNIIAVVGVSTGVVGLALYTFLLRQILLNHFLLQRRAILILIFGLHMAYGGLALHLFWQLLLLLAAAAQVGRHQGRVSEFMREK